MGARTATVSFTDAEIADRVVKADHYYCMARGCVPVDAGDMREAHRLLTPLKPVLSAEEWGALWEALSARHALPVVSPGCDHSVPFPEWTGVDAVTVEVVRRAEVERRALDREIGRVLNQDRWWFNRGRERLEVASMEPRYRRQVQRFIRRRGRGYMEYEARSCSAAAFGAGDMAGLGLEQEAWRLFKESGDPELVEGWLEAKPLMRRLIELDGVCK